MESYYVNKNAQPLSGDNEVHTSKCSFLPKIENREYFGLFNNCNEAVVQAKKKGYNANGCYYCCNSCHTK